MVSSLSLGQRARAIARRSSSLPIFERAACALLTLRRAALRCFSLAIRVRYPVDRRGNRYPPGRWSSITASLLGRALKGVGWCRNKLESSPVDAAAGGLL